MTQEEKSIWDMAAIKFAAALMTRRQSYELQSTEHCLYEGINMADLFIKERKIYFEREDKISSKKLSNLGVKCHLCDKVATKYFGQHNTYPSCDECYEQSNKNIL